LPVGIKVWRCLSGKKRTERLNAKVSLRDNNQKEESMATLWEECLEKIVKNANGLGSEGIAFADVDKEASEVSKHLLSDGDGKYHLVLEVRPRKPRKDKGISKMKPAEEWTHPTPESA